MSPARVLAGSTAALAAAGLAACDPASVEVAASTDGDADWMSARAALWSAEDAEFKLATGIAPIVGRERSGFALCNLEMTENSSPPWRPGASVRADVYVGRDDPPCGASHYWSVLDAERGEVGRTVTSGGEG